MPSFAVEKCKEIVSEMAKISADSFKKATNLMENFKEEFNQMCEAYKQKYSIE